MNSPVDNRPCPSDRGEDIQVGAGPVTGCPRYASNELVSRLRRLNAPEIELCAADAIERLEVGAAITAERIILQQSQEIEQLQRALAFWLPGVPAADAEIAQRAGDDAMLLAGYDGDAELCAEERGWIRLRDAP